MTTLAIKLDPEKMVNPDADLRYELPDALEEATEGRVKADGYDYLDDHSMIIFLEARSPEVVEEVLDLLRRETFYGNRILDTAVIGVDSGAGYAVVHPLGFAGELRVSSEPTLE